MNGIEKITQRIASDAQAEVDRILGDAREEAARISANYRAQADAEAQELDAKNERAAAEQEERLISAAQMKASRLQLAAKQEMVEKAYIQALDKLCAMPKEQYVDVLAKLLVEASSNGKEEAVFSKEDQEQVGKAAVEKANQISGKQLRLSEESLPIRGGFILKDKNVEVNCTFETLVRLQKAETAGAVAKTLFA